MKLDLETWLAVQALMADYSAALDNAELARVQRGGVVAVQLVQREQGVGVDLHRPITSRQ